MGAISGMHDCCKYYQGLSRRTYGDRFCNGCSKSGHPFSAGDSEVVKTVQEVFNRSPVMFIQQAAREIGLYPHCARAALREQLKWHRRGRLVAIKHCLPKTVTSVRSGRLEVLI